MRWPKLTRRTADLCQNDLTAKTVRAHGDTMDHPPQLRKKLIRYPGFGILFIVWTLLGGLAWARHSLVSGVPQGNLLPDLLGFLTCYYPWLLFTPLVFRLEQKYPSREQPAPADRR
jgi:hypothetical protein